MARMSTSPLTCPLDLPKTTFSTTPPFVIGPSITSSPEPSTSSRLSHPYSLHSQVSLPPEPSGIVLIFPPKSNKIPWGRPSLITKAIILARADVALGRQSALDRVLRAKKTLSRSQQSGCPSTVEGWLTVSWFTYIPRKGWKRRLYFNGDISFVYKFLIMKGSLSGAEGFIRLDIFSNISL